MGRIYTAPTINKSVINNTITSTLSAVYTNATGAGAELRAVNINGLQNNATINTTASGASEWTHFGSNVNPIISYSGPTTYGHGEPYQVQLSANRVLLFFLPAYHHRCGNSDFFGGNMIHTQIVEYQTNKYVAGPIQNHTLPAAWFPDSSYNLWSTPNGCSFGWMQPCWKAVALTATKVAVVCQQRSARWLMRFTITGNTVDHAVATLNIGLAAHFNTTTCGPFALDIVPDNTDKVIVGGNGVTTWRVMAFNMPNTGALSPAGSLQDLGVTQNTLYSFGMSKMVRTATSNITPYLFAMSTDATNSSTIAFNFNSSTNAWTSAAPVVQLTAVSNDHTGLECACLSTGTNVNAVIAATTGNSAGNGLVTFYRQTSATTLAPANTRTTLTTQSTQWRTIAEHFQWGNERVVFVGEYGTLVCYDSAGVATNLISASLESVNDIRYMTKWYPFDSRPLYVYYDPAVRNANATGNYKARVNSTASATSVGQTSNTGNYLPWGYDYGEGYAWNEPAGCWMVCQGGRIYAISTAGVVLSELNITSLTPSLTFNHCAAQIQVTATGRLLIGFEYGIKVVPNTSYGPHNSNGGFGNNCSTIVTEPMTSSTQLPTLKAQQGLVGMSGGALCNMVYFNESGSISGAECAYLLYMGSSGTYMRVGFFNGTVWSDLGNTGMNFTDGTWTTGYRPNFKLIQDSPCSSTNSRGLWRILGSYFPSSAANYQFNGISAAYSIATALSSLNTAAYPLSNNTTSNINQTVTQGWATPMHSHNGSRSGTQVATIYDEFLGCTRVYASVNGRLNDWQGYYTPWAPIPVLATATTNLFTVASTSGMYTNMAVRFNGTQFGGVTIGTTYYVLSGFTSTQFSVSTTVGGSALALSTATGSTMTVSLYTSNRWAQIAASKMGYSVALQNTAQVDQQGFNYTFNTVDSTTSQSTQIATIGSGWFVLYRTGKSTWQSYNSTASINTTYSAYGLPDEVKFYLTLDDNAGNVIYLNNGQTLSLTDTTTGVFRSETIYQIPNGYSIKASCDTPNVIALLLTIKEMQ